MRRLPSVHGASIRGRVRTDPGLLLLVLLVVALTTALAGGLGPLTERVSDQAVAAAVRDAGDRSSVVATLPEREDGSPPGARTRDPDTVELLREAASGAQAQVPGPLAGVVRPGVTSLTTPALHLLDAGPGRFLRLAFVDTPQGSPAVRYVDGAAPGASTDDPRLRLPAGAGPWTVEVALSQPAATALDLAPGDVVTAEDEQAREVVVRVTGVYSPVDPAADAWRSTPQLLEPVQGTSDGLARTSAAALVTAAAAPDLVLAVPPDDLTARTVLTPRPSDLRFDEVPGLTRAVATLAAAPASSTRGVAWDSLLDAVLADASSRVTAARGQAGVLLVGLLVGAALVLVLAAQLLVARRAGPVGLGRERGASLADIGAELLVESVLVTVLAAGLGLVGAWVLLGDVDVVAASPVVVVAAVASPLLGVLLAQQTSDVRRAPANRSARRALERARSARRLLAEGVVVVAAVLSWVALHQRGVLGGGLVEAGAPTWWAVAGTLLVLRLVPPAARVALRRARRSTGGVALFTAARVAGTAGRALPLLAVTVAVAQVTFGVALASTERAGQADGALLDVGGDVRVVVAPVAGGGAPADELADDVAGRSGVRAVATGRVVDGVRVASQRRSVAVRLVVVDASAYARVLGSSPLPDAPGLAELGRGAASGGEVPVLLRGGGADLTGRLSLRYDDAASDVALRAVGVAPRVGSTTDPVVVVDHDALAAAGVDVEPDTVWAVGPGAGAAAAAGGNPGAGVTVASTVLSARRAAPLAAGLLDLAVVTSVLLLLLAAVGVVLAAAGDAPGRAVSAGRLRSLGLGHASLRLVVAGELLAPVVVAALGGLALGASAARVTFGDLALERVTGQDVTPGLVVPWWSAGSLVALVAVALALAGVESARLRRASLAELLRGGDHR